MVREISAERIHGHERHLCNKDGIFLGKRDYDLVIAHEQGHIDGKEHTLFGVMSGYGLIRLLTA